MSLIKMMLVMVSGAAISRTFVLFFFSSRRRHTRSKRDWSSDVCSSDLATTYKPLGITGAPFILRDFDHWKAYRDSKLFADLAKGYDDKSKHKIVAITYYRSEERRVGKECRSGWWEE